MINDRFPRFITQLLEYQEFGWVLVKINDSQSHLYGKCGSLILHKDGTFNEVGNPFPQLKPDEILETIRSFSYYSPFPNNGDIVLFGNITAQKKVYSFENHKGTHGGFYGSMVYPFIISSRTYDNLNSMESLFNSIWRGIEEQNESTI